MRITENQAKQSEILLSPAGEHYLVSAFKQ